MLFVGIDIAKRNHEASVIAQDGHVVRKAMRFANSQAGYNKFMDMVRSLSEPVVFGMETTGHYWLTLYTHLRNDGFTVHVINPTQSDALRGMYIRKTKTDSVDSVIIADVIRFGRYCETSVDPGDLQAMRELCRQRFYIIDMASDLKRKVIALLDQVFPEYEKLFSDSFGLSSMELLSQYTTPEEMLSVSSQQLAEVLKKASRGRLGAEKAVEIQDAAKNSFGIVMASSSFSLIIRQYIEQIRSLESSVDIFDTEIARLLSGFDPMLLGYRKEDNPILPPEHLRGVFNLTGIVHPTVLADGRIVARWREKEGKVELMPFENIGVRTKKRIEREVEKWFEVKEIRGMEI